MHSFVVLRTHGGLGNQLFQVLFGRLHADCHGLVLREAHDLRYHHFFPRSEVLARGDLPSAWQSLVSTCRVPKLLQRTFGRAESPWRLGNTTYLDGYFQQAQAYEPFAPQAIGRQLQRLADELSIKPAAIDQRLIHLRVGDFFTDRTAACSHVLERLVQAPQGVAVMTNDESLLCEPEIAATIAERDMELVSTQGMAAEDVLRTMARYRRIDANDSTLTFWSSVLAGCDVALQDDRLRACRDLFRRYHLGC